MAFYGNEPVRFSKVSMVTATLGANDPQVGATTRDGDEEYLFVYNTGGSTINVGHGCTVSAVTGYSVTVSSVTSVDILVGVCKHSAIATTEYGWVVTRGWSSIEMNGSSGTVAAGGLCELGTDGVFSPISNTTGNKSPSVVKAMEAIVSSASGQAFISVT